MDFHAGQRDLQRRFGTEGLADRIVEVVGRSALTDDDRAFVEGLPNFFLATADAAGQPDCSHKGGRPGFVRVLDEHTLEFPDYDGNGMFRSLGNIAANAGVGLLFVDFASPRRLRVNGRATLHDDAETLARHHGAHLVVRVRVVDVFPNCPRYLPADDGRTASVHAPAPGHAPPEPEWKRMPVFAAHVPGREGSAASGTPRGEGGGGEPDSGA